MRDRGGRGREKTLRVGDIVARRSGRSTARSGGPVWALPWTGVSAAPFGRGPGRPQGQGRPSSRPPRGVDPRCRRTATGWPGAHDRGQRKRFDRHRRVSAAPIAVGPVGDLCISDSVVTSRGRRGRPGTTEGPQGQFAQSTAEPPPCLGSQRSAFSLMRGELDPTYAR